MPQGSRLGGDPPSPGYQAALAAGPPAFLQRRRFGWEWFRDFWFRRNPGEAPPPPGYLAALAAVPPAFLQRAEGARGWLPEWFRQNRGAQTERDTMDQCTHITTRKVPPGKEVTLGLHLVGLMEERRKKSKTLKKWRHNMAAAAVCACARGMAKPEAPIYVSSVPSKR